MSPPSCFPTTRQGEAEGRKVYLADVAPTTDVVNGTGGIAATVDVARPDDMETLAETASDARLVCLNAGITGPTMGPSWEAPFAEWEHMLRTNLLGVVNGLRAFVPRLLAADEPGHILITASLAGLVTFPGGGAYAATKHAVVAVAEQAAMVLGDSHVAVTVLCPALVRSGMSEIGADPGDVAAIALQACRDGRFAVIDEEWKQAVIDRGTQLATGAQPVPSRNHGSATASNVPQKVGHLPTLHGIDRVRDLQGERGST